MNENDTVSMKVTDKFTGNRNLLLGHTMSREVLNIKKPVDKVSWHHTARCSPLERDARQPRLLLPEGQREKSRPRLWTFQSLGHPLQRCGSPPALRAFLAHALQEAEDALEQALLYLVASAWTTR